MISPLLPPVLVGAITFVAMLALVLGAFVALSPAVLLKLLPLPALQRAASRWCIAVAVQWVAANQLVYRLIHAEQWDVTLRTPLERGRSYLVLCNHQSWTDILVLFDVLHGRAPFPRFFLKHALKYFPVIGQACWAMDFPFMKRHSRAAIAANPALRHEDLATTRRACAIYREQPVTIINFAEGTRFSEDKRTDQGSPYRHLLRPKAAGSAFAIAAMGDQFAGVVDVTLAYRATGKALLWSWLCGEQDTMAIHADVLPIPAEFLRGDYDQDPEYRARFQAWLNAIWTRKDARLERLANARPAMPQQRPAHG